MNFSKAIEFSFVDPHIDFSSLIDPYICVYGFLCSYHSTKKTRKTEKICKEQIRLLSKATVGRKLFVLVVSHLMTSVLSSRLHTGEFKKLSQRTLYIHQNTIT